MIAEDTLWKIQKKLNEQKKFKIEGSGIGCYGNDSSESTGSGSENEEESEEMSPRKRMRIRMERARKQKSVQCRQDVVCHKRLEEKEFREAIQSLPKLAQQIMKKKDDGNSKCETVLNGIKLFPELIQKACQIATALPMTQVSVERVFSGLKFLTSDQRSHMESDLIDSMVFLQMNKEYI